MTDWILLVSVLLLSVVVVLAATLFTLLLDWYIRFSFWFAVVMGAIVIVLGAGAIWIWTGLHVVEGK